MANTNIGFTINIEGIDNIDQLNKEIKQTNKELNSLTKGTEEYAQTAEKLAKLKAEQKALRKEQTELTKSFLETSSALGAYDKASAKLNRLRKEFKNLAIEGKESSKRGKELRMEIEKLDTQLKKTDKSVGQFQRNVGNYPRVFGQSTKAIFKQIPALDKLNKRLEKTTGVSNVLGKALVGGFVAFQTAKVVVQVAQQLDELIKKIDETRNAVSQLSGVGGEELDELTADVTALAQTFEVDSTQIAKSAQALSQQLGISFDEALVKIENGLKAGQVSNEEFLSSIEQAPEAFEDVGDAAGDYANRIGGVLEANKELAAAQIELTNEFVGTGEQFKTFSARAQAFLIKTLIAIVKLFQPVVDAFKDAGAAVQELFSGFKEFNNEAGATKILINVLIQPLKTTAAILQFVAQRFASVVRAAKDFIDASPFLQKVVQNLITGFQQLQKGFDNLPFTFAGILESIKQLGRNLSAFYENQFINAQIFAAKVKGVFGAAVKDQITELRKRQKELRDASISIGEAFSKGFNEAKEKADKRAAEREKEQALIAQQNQENALAKQRSKQAQERRQKALEAAKKQREAIAKERQKFLAEEAKFIEKQQNIITKLAERQEKLIIQGIQDAQVKARTIAQQASAERVEAAQAEFDKLSDLATEREAEALRLFGEGSQQLKDAQGQAASDRIAAEEALNGIILRERIALANELLAIDESFAEKQLAMQSATLDKRQAELQSAISLERLKLEEELAKRLISEKEYQQASFDLDKKRIEAELKLLEERSKLENADNDQILLEKQQLYTELAKLDDSFTKKAEANDKARIDSLKTAQEQALKDFQTAFKSAADFALQGIKFIGDFQDAQFERRQDQLARDKEAQEQANQALQDRLSNATGLERQFLEQKVAANQEAQAKIAKQQQDLEKQAAKARKRRAIGESIVQTALAVVEALPNPAAAIAAGIAGAAQTAIIAAQQFATGGKVGRGNIKPLSNGDNVLATLKTNEVVLNESQQKSIGGAPVLRAAGVPGFANGGLVGSPSPAVLNSIGEAGKYDQILKELVTANAATNSRIDRLQVNWTANTQEESEKRLNERKDIQFNASF